MSTPQSLTVLAPIVAGQVETLRARLRRIGDDIRGVRREAGGANPHIDFPASEQIHFARFAILTDPDRGSDRSRLLFASAYDGTLDAHLAELIHLTSNPDMIWGACEGYAGVDAFADFIRAHANEPAAFYIAFRDESATSIRQALRVARGTTASPVANAPPFIVRLGDRINRLVRAAPILADVTRALVRYGFTDVYKGVNRIIASLSRYPFFRVVNRITGNELPPRKSPHSSVALDYCAQPAPLVAGDEIPTTAPEVPPSFREDVVVQNQLTLVTVIDAPAERRVRAVMSSIDSYARRLAPPGSLIGISTIHFVRWLVIDGGRRLMMVSDYDGSWENYIDEFAEMILSGLDAIWETSYGYPPDGARDLPAFKRFLRRHQVPSELFFSAYPNATIQNVASATRMRKARSA